MSGTNYDVDGIKQAQDESLQYGVIVYPKDIWFLGAPNFFLNGVACPPKEAGWQTGCHLGFEAPAEQQVEGAAKRNLQDVLVGISDTPIALCNSLGWVCLRKLFST